MTKVHIVRVINVCFFFSYSDTGGSELYIDSVKSISIGSVQDESLGQGETSWNTVCDQGLGVYSSYA